MLWAWKARSRIQPKPSLQRGREQSWGSLNKLFKHQDFNKAPTVNEALVSAVAPQKLFNRVAATVHKLGLVYVAWLPHPKKGMGQLCQLCELKQYICRCLLC